MKTSPKLEHLQKIYRDAAELIASNESRYSCGALLRVNSRWAVRSFFKSLFLIKSREHLSAWYGKFTPRNREARTLALLLCAEILRTDPEMWKELTGLDQ